MYICFVLRKGTVTHKSGGHDSIKHLLGLEQPWTRQTLSKILLN